MQGTLCVCVFVHLFFLVLKILFLFRATVHQTDLKSNKFQRDLRTLCLHVTVDFESNIGCTQIHNIFLEGKGSLPCLCLSSELPFIPSARELI